VEGLILLLILLGGFYLVVLPILCFVALSRVGEAQRQLAVLQKTLREMQARLAAAQGGAGRPATAPDKLATEPPAQPLRRTADAPAALRV